MQFIIAALFSGALLLSSHASAGLKSPLKFSEEAPSLKPVVLVFIANETSLNPSSEEAENTSTLLKWLKNFGTEPSLKAAENITFDQQHFGRVIDTDINDISKGVMATLKPVSAILFSNRLAKDQRYIYFRTGIDQQMQEGVFSWSKEGRPLADGQPFSNQAVFREALRVTADTFNPHEYSFVLVTKSHGSAVALLRPKVLLDTKTLTEAEFRQGLLTLPQTFSSLIQVGKQLGVRDRTGIESYESAFSIEGIGITKNQFISTLIELSAEQSLRFELVFAFACNSSLAESEAKRLRSVVTRPAKVYYGSDERGLDYQDLSFQRVFERLNQSEGNLTQTMTEELNGLVFKSEVKPLAN